MKVTIHDYGQHEEEMLQACLKRAQDYMGDSFQYGSATIFVNKREKIGWLEYGIRIEHGEGNGGIYIGAVQRKPGAEVEFHS